MNLTAYPPINYRSSQGAPAQTSPDCCESAPASISASLAQDVATKAVANLLFSIRIPSTDGEITAKEELFRILFSFSTADNTNQGEHFAAALDGMLIRPSFSVWDGKNNPRRFNVEKVGDQIQLQEQCLSNSFDVAAGLVMLSWIPIASVTTSQLHLVLDSLGIKRWLGLFRQNLAVLKWSFANVGLSTAPLAAQCAGQERAARWVTRTSIYAACLRAGRFS